jgi:hypothetical protein
MGGMGISVGGVFWLGGVFAFCSDNFLSLVYHCVFDVLGDFLEVSLLVCRVFLGFIGGLGMTVGTIDQMAIW